MMRAWHRKGRPQLSQFPRLVRDLLSINGGSITRFKTKKMKVQNDSKHAHMVCTSHSTSLGVIGSLGELQRAETDKLMQKLLKSRSTGLSRASVLKRQSLVSRCRATGFSFPFCFLADLGLPYSIFKLLNDPFILI